MDQYTYFCIFTILFFGTLNLINEVINNGFGPKLLDEKFLAFPKRFLTMFPKPVAESLKIV